MAKIHVRDHSMHTVQNFRQIHFLTLLSRLLFACFLKKSQLKQLIQKLRNYRVPPKETQLST
jgi:hypothetical protein